MTETIFDPKAPREDKRRCERVELDGGVVYVKEMQAADSLFCLEHSVRPSPGPGGQSIDVGGMQIWQVVVSCYRGPEPDAGRVFEITDVHCIRELRNSDWRRLQDAIERVNGLAESEVAAAQDFTGAARDGSPATLRSGASSNSTASLVR